ncbi:MAG: ferrochelatase [Alphaproteobacteria bacterium]
MTKNIAVVLFNLGGPSSKDSIEPFLMNFFMDKNIVSAPTPIRFLLAKYISKKRSKREAGESYQELGDKSPLLENSQEQANALEKVLNSKNDGHSYKVFVSMRYWHPMAPEVVKNIKNWNADKVILLPLYPQFSTTTTWSSLESFKAALSDINYNPEISMICCYPYDQGFIETSAENIYNQYQQAQNDGHKNPRILFSAHGLPEKIIKGGDPYQHQCEQGAEKIATCLADKYGVEGLDWKICYQSRVGRLKWIGPSLDEELDKAINDQKAVVIYPHAFTQEHVETLVELDIEYKEIAEDKGIRGYYRAKTVGTAPKFIESLSILVNDHLEKISIKAQNGTCLCPDNFSRCAMRVGTL